MLYTEVKRIYINLNIQNINFINLLLNIAVNSFTHVVSKSHECFHMLKQ